MSFTDDEILDSIADDIGQRRSYREFLRRDTGKPDGVSFIRRKARGREDWTPEWRMRGRGTNERKAERPLVDGRRSSRVVAFIHACMMLP